MLELKIDYNINFQYYQELIDNLDPSKLDYTIAHNPSIPAILQKTFGFTPACVNFFSNKELVGIMIGCFVKNKFVSMPHFSYGWPILKYSVMGKFNSVVIKNLDKFEIRSFFRLSDFCSHDKVVSYLILQKKPDDQFKIFKYNIRRQVKISIEKGVIVKIGHLEYLNIFYKIYCKNMIRLGSPPQPKLFFKNLMVDYKDGRCEIFIAFYRGIPIGGSFVLSYKGFCENCWSATDYEYNSLFTPYLLYWKIIENAIINNDKVFSFGRSSKNSNTLTFKKHWHPIERELFYNYSELNKATPDKFRRISKCFTRIAPMFLTILLGKFVSKIVY